MTPSEYLMPRDAEEKRRLDKQQDLYKAAFDGKLVPSNITLPQNVSLFDSGTGSGIFLRDFITSTPSNIHFDKVVGWDISPAQFPPENERRVGNVAIEYGVHDVLEPVSAEWQGIFDLVNQRSLGSGLKEEEWSTALSNLSTMLKPDGYLNIVEPILFCDETAEVIKTVNKVFEVLPKLGKRFDCVEGAAKWMRKASFEDIKVLKVKWQCGPMSDKGEAFGTASAENFYAVTSGIYKSLLVKSPQLLPQEIRTAEQADAFLARVHSAFHEQGSAVTVGMVAGRKPRN